MQRDISSIIILLIHHLKRESIFAPLVHLDFQFMAKKSVIARSLKKPKFSTRKVNRCFKCGRKHGYMRDFDLCRICFRELANEGKIPGVRKSSW